jgi:HSP20 family molecular chaperone IbpA
MESETLLYINGERTNRIGDTFAIQEKLVLDEEAYNLDSIHANLSDGVLEIRIQKKPVPQPRIISISTKKDD